MAIAQRILKTILEKEIHPFVVTSALYDRQVENRLEILTDTEKAFQEQYGHSLFLQVDVESRLVRYEVESLGIGLQFSW